MKDILENFIKKNRQDFDIHTPDPEIWKRIKPGFKKGKDFSKLLKFTYRIAAVIIIFVASYAFHEMRSKRQLKQLSAQDEVIYKQIPELKEAEFYYTNMVDKKLIELKPLIANIPGLEKEIQLDLEELDSIYLSFKSDLIDNIANDQVIEAMIQNYRLKIQILEDLLLEFKQENGQENEKEYIDHI